MLIQERSHQDPSQDYRYGFQGQEMDNEIKGEGNSLNYTFRMHDPRVGRFFAIDPLAPKYPFYSPYQFGGNNPIFSIELEGLEPSKINTPIQEPYQGDIASFEAENAKGTIPSGWSNSQRWNFGGYTITPNYVKVNENTAILSHYTASITVKDMNNGMKDIQRFDWIIPYAKLGEFKEKVQLYGGAANLMYGSNTRLSDWQINYLNGNKAEALKGYYKEQWSVRNVLFSVMATVGTMTTMSSRNIAAPKRQGITPAQRLANKAQDLPASIRPNTVAVVETSDGKFFVGRNQGGVINSTTISEATEVGMNQYHAQCAEINAISRARNAGVNVEGSKISVANVRGKSSTTGKHGSSKTPCSTCKGVLEKNNISVEE